MAGRLIIGIGLSLLLVWAALLVTLAIVRPKRSTLREAVRLLPDSLRLLRSIAGDRSLAKAVRIRPWMLFAYLAFPIDLVPDFIPVLGYADDAIIVAVVLRSVVRKAGPDAVRVHWQGSPEGLATLWKLAGLPSAG